jgi:hypothetical protein
MSKLSGRKAPTTKHLLGDIEITLKPIPFGKVLEIQANFEKIKDKGDSEQLPFIKNILLDFLKSQKL